MKQYTLPFLIFLGGVILITIGCITNEKPVRKQPVSVEYFKAGDILYPDYACPDTLVVVNADKLNKDMALIEQGIIDATDGEIDSVLHLSCELYEGSYYDQFTKLKALRPTWDSLQIDQAIKED
jgi:hypothetical protein